MEPANLHHQQLQQQQLVESSHLATPNNILHNNGTNFNINTYINGEITNSRDPSLNATNSMIQDLGFGSLFSHDLQFARIKEELSSSDHSNPNFASGFEINANGLHRSAAGGQEFLYSNPQEKYGPSCRPSRGTFSQIFPSINISNYNQSSSNSSVNSPNPNLEVSLEALDLFNSSRFSGNLSQSSHHNHLGVSKSRNSLPYSLDNMQRQLSHRPSDSPTNVSPFSNGATEAKRSSSSIEAKTPQATPKKSRLDSRSSCPPFKVRKERLGDRIAALQQLVAPFGKTDTSSVLMEVIGYINFLHNQVETLSVPYMKPSRNKARKMQGGSEKGGGREEATQDLKSRGLCLVPLTSLAYMTDGGDGGSVWPPLYKI